MKLNGLMGTGSGKLGNSVFSVAGGEQIVRQYQPNVANPSTIAQVNQRARMKLMSQLAADLAPVIAIPKDGLKSSRNKFISRNFDYSMSADGIAQITLENVQLTEGRNGLPQVVATRSSESGLEVSLAEDASKDISRVVYIVYKKTSEQKLQLVQSAIVSNQGQGGTFSKDFPFVSGEIIIYAYGMKDTSAAATAKFGNLSCQSGTDVAQLIANRTISAAEYAFTETRGGTMGTNDMSISPVADGQARVFVTASGDGTVTGAGTFAIGSSVTVTATPGTGKVFRGWRINGGNTYISTTATYTFTLQSTTDLVGVFETPSSGHEDED